jgi:hypothetical protein
MIGVGFFSPLFSPFCGSANGSVFSSWSINRTEIPHLGKQCCGSGSALILGVGWIPIRNVDPNPGGRKGPTKIERVKEKFMF